ncbi:hypothetical protein Hanom_Chr05g00443961 [Helianthus anomalus]
MFISNCRHCTFGQKFTCGVLNLSKSCTFCHLCETWLEISINSYHAAQFYQFSDADEEEFEFSPDEQVSGKQIDDFGFIFPVGNSAVEETDDATSLVSVQLHKSSVDEQGSYSSSSFSSSEAVENECNCKPSGIFCMWSVFEKCKKRSSTGLSRRWRIFNLPSRSKREGEESLVFLRSKKADASKDRRVTGKLKTVSFHEVFYV